MLTSAGSALQVNITSNEPLYGLTSLPGGGYAIAMDPVTYGAGGIPSLPATIDVRLLDSTGAPTGGEISFPIATPPAGYVVMAAVGLAMPDGSIVIATSVYNATTSSSQLITQHFSAAGVSLSPQATFSLLQQNSYPYPVARPSGGFDIMVTTNNAGVYSTTIQTFTADGAPGASTPFTVANLTVTGGREMFNASGQAVYIFTATNAGNVSGTYALLPGSATPILLPGSNSVSGNVTTSTMTLPKAWFGADGATYVATANSTFTTDNSGATPTYNVTQSSMTIYRIAAGASPTPVLTIAGPTGPSTNPYFAIVPADIAVLADGNILIASDVMNSNTSTVTSIREYTPGGVQVGPNIVVGTPGVPITNLAFARLANGSVDIVYSQNGNTYEQNFTETPPTMAVWSGPQTIAPGAGVTRENFGATAANVNGLITFTYGYATPFTGNANVQAYSFASVSVDSLGNVVAGPTYQVTTANATNPQASPGTQLNYSTVPFSNNANIWAMAWPTDNGDGTQTVYLNILNTSTNTTIASLPLTSVALVPKSSSGNDAYTIVNSLSNGTVIAEAEIQSGGTVSGVYQVVNSSGTEIGAGTGFSFSDGLAHVYGVGGYNANLYLEAVEVWNGGVANTMLRYINGSTGALQPRPSGAGADVVVATNLSAIRAYSWQFSAASSTGMILLADGVNSSSQNGAFEYLVDNTGNATTGNINGSATTVYNGAVIQDARLTRLSTTQFALYWVDSTGLHIKLQDQNLNTLQTFDIAECNAASVALMVMGDGRLMAEYRVATGTGSAQTTVIKEEILDTRTGPLNGSATIIGGNIAGTQYNDTFNLAGTTATTVVGAGGNDTFVAPSSASGPVNIYGGYQGQANGTDLVTYAGTSSPLTISLGAAVPGSVVANGTTLAVLNNIADAIGGTGIDVITGNSAANVLEGGGGSDTFSGGGGADVFFFQPSDLAAGSVQTITDYQRGVNEIRIEGLVNLNGVTLSTNANGSYAISIPVTGGAATLNVNAQSGGLVDLVVTPTVVTTDLTTLGVGTANTTVLTLDASGTHVAAKQLTSYNAANQVYATGIVFHNGAGTLQTAADINNPNNGSYTFVNFSNYANGAVSNSQTYVANVLTGRIVNNVNGSTDTYAYNPDGSYSWTETGVPNVPYAREVRQFNASNLIVSDQFYLADGSLYTPVSPATVNVYLANKGMFDSLAGGVVVADTAANISANLSALASDPHITSIVISDNALVNVSVAQLTSAAAAFALLQNANASAYHLRVLDTTTNIVANLAALAGNASITAVQSSNGAPVNVSVATFLANKTALDKLSNGFGVSDTQANIQANLAAIQADGSHLRTVLTEWNGVGPTVLPVTNAAGTTALTGRAYGQFVNGSIQLWNTYYENFPGTNVAAAYNVDTYQMNPLGVLTSGPTLNAAVASTSPSGLAGYYVQNGQAYVSPTSVLYYWDKVNADGTYNFYYSVTNEATGVSSLATILYSNVTLPPPATSYTPRGNVVDTGFASLNNNNVMLALEQGDPAAGPETISLSIYSDTTASIISQQTAATFNDGQSHAFSLGTWGSNYALAYVTYTGSGASQTANIVVTPYSPQGVAGAPVTFATSLASVDQISWSWSGQATNGPNTGIYYWMLAVDGADASGNRVHSLYQADATTGVVNSVLNITYTGTVYQEARIIGGNPGAWVVYWVDGNGLTINTVNTYGNVPTIMSSVTIPQANGIANVSAIGDGRLLATWRVTNIADPVNGVGNSSVAYTEIIDTRTTAIVNTTGTPIFMNGATAYVAGTAFNDVITHLTGATEVLNGGGGVDTYVLTYSSSQVAVSINADGSVRIAATPDSSVDTLQQFSTIQLSGATIAISGNVLTQTNSDGTSVVSTFNITGQPYVKEVVAYDAGHAVVSDTRYNADGSVYNPPSGPVTIAYYLANQAALDSQVGGFAISDTAAHLSAALEQIKTDGHINSIVVSDNAQVTVSLAQLNYTVVALMHTADGSALQLRVLDSSANIVAGLAQIANATSAYFWAQISVQTSDVTPVSVNAATFTANQAVLDKIVGGFVIADTAANIAGALNQIASDTHVTSITVSDNASVTMSIAQLSSDATTLAKLANANATPYHVAIVDTAANISSALNQLAANSHVSSIVVSNNIPVNVSTAQLTSDAGAIALLQNANATPYQIRVFDTQANIIAAEPAIRALAGHINGLVTPWNNAAAVVLPDSNAPGTTALAGKAFVEIIYNGQIQLVSNFIQNYAGPGLVQSYHVDTWSLNAFGVLTSGPTRDTAIDATNPSYVTGTPYGSNTVPSAFGGATPSFMLPWLALNPDGTTYTAYYKVVNQATGVATAPAIITSSITLPSTPAYAPVGSTPALLIASTGDGNGIVGWESQSGGTTTVTAELYTGSSQTLGAPISVATFSDGLPHYLSLGRWGSQYALATAVYSGSGASQVANVSITPISLAGVVGSPVTVATGLGSIDMITWSYNGTGTTGPNAGANYWVLGVDGADTSGNRVHNIYQVDAASGTINGVLSIPYVGTVYSEAQIRGGNPGGWDVYWVDGNGLTIGVVQTNASNQPFIQSTINIPGVNSVSNMTTLGDGRLLVTWRQTSGSGAGETATEYTQIFDTRTAAVNGTGVVVGGTSIAGTIFDDHFTHILGATEVLNGGGGNDTYVLPYSSSQVAVSINADGSVRIASTPDSSVDTLQQFSTIQLTGATIAISGNVLTQSNSDGTSVVSTFNIAGQPYVETVETFGQNHASTGVAYYKADGSQYVPTTTVTAAYFLANQATLDATAGGFSINDVASEIANAFPQMSVDTHINSVVIADNIPVFVTTSGPGLNILSKLVNANGSPGQISLNESTSFLSGDLPFLQAHLAQIASISPAPGGPGLAQISIVDYVAYKQVLAKASGMWELADNAATIGANADLIQSDPSISATPLMVVDGLPVPLTFAQFDNDQTVVQMIRLAGGHVVIKDTSANISANLNQLIPGSPTYAANADIVNGLISTDGGVVTKTAAQYSSISLPPISTTGGGVVNVAIVDDSGNLGMLLNPLGGPVSPMGPLSDPNVVSVTITNNAPPTSSVSTLTGDLTRLHYANGAHAQLAIMDTAQNILNNLGLLQSDIAYIASLGSMGSALVISAADFMTYKSLFALTGGFSVNVQDTAANISGILDQFASTIPNGWLTVTDSAALPISATQLVNDTTALASLYNQDGSPYHLTITDTASNVGSALNQIAANASHITGVTISDNAQITLSIAMLTSDASALALLKNANNSPYQLRILDTPANILANLATLAANTHIATIQASFGAPVDVSVATFLANQPVLNKLASGFGIVDTQANITANFAALKADALHLRTLVAPWNGATPAVLPVSNDAGSTALPGRAYGPLVAGYFQLWNSYYQNFPGSNVAASYLVDTYKMDPFGNLVSGPTLDPVIAAMAPQAIATYYTQIGEVALGSGANVLRFWDNTNPDGTYNVYYTVTNETTGVQSAQATAFSSVTFPAPPTAYAPRGNIGNVGFASTGNGNAMLGVETFNAGTGVESIQLELYNGATGILGAPQTVATFNDGKAHYWSLGTWGTNYALATVVYTAGANPTANIVVTPISPAGVAGTPVTFATGLGSVDQISWSWSATNTNYWVLGVDGADTSGNRVHNIYQGDASTGTVNGTLSLAYNGTVSQEARVIGGNPGSWLVYWVDASGLTVATLSTTSNNVPVILSSINIPQANSVANVQALGDGRVLATWRVTTAAGDANNVGAAGVEYTEILDTRTAGLNGAGVALGNGGATSYIAGTTFNDTITHTSGVQALAGAGGTDSYVLTYSASQVTVSINADGSVRVASTPDSSVDTLQQFSTIQLSDATIAISGNTLTQTNNDGTSVVSTFNITGQPYTSEVKRYDVGHNLVSDTFYKADGTVYTPFGGTATVAYYLANTAALDAMVGGFAIADTAANLLGALAQLAADSKINAVTITDNAALSLGTAHVGPYLALLVKTQNQNGSGYVLNISDSAANIATYLDELNAVATHIGSISTSGPVVLSATGFVADHAVVLKIPGSISIADTGAHVSAVIDQLSAFFTSGGSRPITLTGGVSPVLTVTAAQAVADANVIAAIVNTQYAIQTTQPNGSYDTRVFGSGGTFQGLAYATYDYHYNAGGFLDSITYFDGAGGLVGSVTYAANGGYGIYVGTNPVFVETVNPDNSHDDRIYTGGTFQGLTYTSYDNHVTSGGFRDLVTFYDAGGNALGSQSYAPNGGFGITVGSTVVYQKTIHADLSYDERFATGGTFQGLPYASYDNHVTAAGFRDLITFYDAGGNTVGSQSYATNGGYSITVGSNLIFQETINPDTSRDDRTYTGGTFQGLSYASYDYHYTTGGFRDLITYYDAGGAVIGSQSFAANGGFGITVGSTVVYQKTIHADLSYDERIATGGTFQGLPYASYDNHVTAAGFRDLVTFYDAGGNTVGSQGYAPNGGYSLAVGSNLVFQETINPDTTRDDRTYTGGTFQGLAYASYDYHYTTGGFRDLITYYDAGGAVIGSQSFAANGGFGITVGSTVVYQKTIHADLSYDERIATGGTFQGLPYASYDNHVTAAGFRDLVTFYDAGGNTVGSQGYASNGGYSLTVGSNLVFQETINPDSTRDDRTYTGGTFQGLAYASYDYHYTTGGFRDSTTYYSAGGAVVGSTTYAPNGGYGIYIGTNPTFVETVNADSTKDDRIYTAGTFQGLAYASYDNHYTTGGFRDLATFYDGAGQVVGTQSYAANGGFTITVGGNPVLQQTVNPDNSQDQRTWSGGTFQGIAYASYDYHYTPGGFRDLITYYNAGGAVIGSQGFATNGGFSITVGGTLMYQKTINADLGYDERIATGGTFQGLAYAAYDNHYTAAGFRDLITFYDAGGAALGTQSYAANGGFAIKVGANVVYQKTINGDLSQDELIASAGTFQGLAYASYDNHYTAGGFRDLITFYDAGGTALGTQGYTANGGLSITVGSTLKFQKTVNVDLTHDERTYSAGVFQGVAYASSDNHYTAAGFRDLVTYYDAGNAVLASQSFAANGGFATTIGGTLTFQETINVDLTRDDRTYVGGTFQGLAYASYDYHYTLAGFRDTATYYSAGGAVVGSVTYAQNGGFGIYIGTSPTFVETVNADSSRDDRIYTGGTFQGLSYTSYDNHITAGGFRDLVTFYDAGGGALGSQSYTPTGGFGITVGGNLMVQQNNNLDGSYSLAYYQLTGRPYTSYEDDYDTSGARIVDYAVLNDGSGDTRIYGSNLTFAKSAPGGVLQESTTSGADTFSYTPHPVEVLNPYGGTNDQFVFGAGFGNETIKNFGSAASGNTINFGSLFVDNNDLIAHMSQSGGNTIITDNVGDTLTIVGFTPATLAGRITA